MTDKLTISQATLPTTACATTTLSYFPHGLGGISVDMPGPPCPTTGDHHMSVTVATCKLGRLEIEMIGAMFPLTSVGAAVAAEASELVIVLSLENDVLDGGMTLKVLVRGKLMVYWLE